MTEPEPFRFITRMEIPETPPAPCTSCGVTGAAHTDACFYWGRSLDGRLTPMAAAITDAELAAAHLGYLFADEQTTTEAEARWPLLARLSLSIAVLTAHSYDLVEGDGDWAVGYPDGYGEDGAHAEAITAIRTAYRRAVEAIADR